jgi:predicted Rossmann fold flavoprotein
LDKNIAIIGGGAAGFFCAAQLAEKFKSNQITIFERADNVLQKVKISGGGRCNVTHASAEPKELVKSYPRGTKELLGPFYTFDTQSTIEWFEKNGVPLKTEADGRMFPTTDSSQTIIDCLWKATVLKGVVLKTRCGVTHFEFENNQWKLTTDKGVFFADTLVIATGSSPNFWNSITTNTNHTRVAPVPSLFTFNCLSPLFQNLAGVAVQNAEVKIADSKFEATGPVLITHWGLSGPAILRLSAWGARWLNEKEYKFTITINWKPGWNKHQAFEWLQLMKKQHPKKKLATLNPELPTRLWQSLILNAVGNEERMLADLTNLILEKIATALTSTQLNINGKSTFKDEFVTAGGIALNEIDFKTFQSKLHPGLFFAGEVLNIDAITGGYNFQAAWTGGYLAAKGIEGYLEN